MTREAVTTLKGGQPRGHRLPINGFVMWLAVAWLALVLFGAAFADLLPLRDPVRDLDYAAALSGPTLAHPLGADGLGRDILARLVYGSRISLVIGVGVVAAGCLIGATVGVVAGYYRQKTDAAIVVVLDAILAFPSLILAMVLAAFLGQSLRNVVIAIAIPMIPGFARLARASTLVQSRRDFVLMARAMGAGNLRILIREIAPNVMRAVLAYALVATGIAILIEGGLSFLSLGVPTSSPSWGSMIADGTPRLATAPFISLIPSAAMLLTVLSLNLVADGMQAGGDRGIVTQVRR